MWPRCPCRVRIWRPSSRVCLGDGHSVPVFYTYSVSLHHRVPSLSWSSTLAVELHLCPKATGDLWAAYWAVLQEEGSRSPGTRSSSQPSTNMLKGVSEYQKLQEVGLTGICLSLTDWVAGVEGEPQEPSSPQAVSGPRTTCGCGFDSCGCLPQPCVPSSPCARHSDCAQDPKQGSPGQQLLESREEGSFQESGWPLDLSDWLV